MAVAHASALAKGRALQTIGAAATLGFKRMFAAAADKITVEVVPFKTHRIEQGPSNKVETSIAELKEMYTRMTRMRRMEIAADMSYKAKLIRGFCHLYDGQEAVLGGMEFALTTKDSMITSYRNHCQVLTRGGTVNDVIAELFGKATGASKGVGGSMHMYNRKNHYYGGCGIVGAQVPLGAGMAFAHKYNKDGSVAVTMYGDGAANQGQIYEAFNMAGLWGLPCIFICENNHYGMGTAEWRAAKSSAFYTRGDYVPGIKVDGMDILAVKQATAFAKAHALEKGPIVMEMDTYRYHGHSMSDPGSTYRTREEINTMRQERDPLERVKKLLLANGVPDSEIKAIERAAKKEVDEAVEAAKKAPLPKVEWAFRNVYVDNTNMELRNVQGEYFKPSFDLNYSV